jgi:hypothetical protein
MSETSKPCMPALLKGVQVLLCKGVGFGDDWDEVDAGAEALHDANVLGLQVDEQHVRSHRTPEVELRTYGQ